MLPTLLVTRSTLQLNPVGEGWRDIAAFRTLLAEDRPGIERLEAAVALYRGELLAGWIAGDSAALQDWLTVRRDEFTGRVLAALQRLAAEYEAQQNDDRVEACLRRQLAMQPWREEAHHDLMRLLAPTGRRTAALAQFESCTRALRADLDVEPSRETAVLCERIRDGGFADEAARSAQVPRRGLAPRGSSGWPVKGRPAPAFVGRQRELARLAAQLEATLQGQGRVAFVVGEAGAGKTALLAEFAARAMQRHGELVVALGSCNGSSIRRRNPSRRRRRGCTRCRWRRYRKWATLLRGRTRARQGAFEEGLDLMRHGLAAWRSTGSVTTVPAQYCVAIHTCLEEGRPDSGLQLVQEALELAEKHGLRCFLPEFVRLKGELLLPPGDVAVRAEAEACFAQALEAARRQRARTWELRSALSMARLWQRYGRCEDARALLAVVYDWFTEGFDTPDLRDARALLAELSGAGGETHPYPAHGTG